LVISPFFNDRGNLSQWREEREWRLNRPKSDEEIDRRGHWSGGLITWDIAKEFASSDQDYGIKLEVEEHTGLTSAIDKYKRIRISADNWMVMVEQTDSHPYFPDPSLPDDLKFGDEAPFCFPWPVRQWTYKNVASYKQWSKPLEDKLKHQIEQARLDEEEQKRRETEAQKEAQASEDRAETWEQRKGCLTVVAALAAVVIYLVW
jgi:hypothetical protein